MNTLPRVERVADIRYGQDPVMDAWLLHFMTENNLEYSLNPLLNAPPEQLRFMVSLEEDQVFVPCSDELFQELLKAHASPYLRHAYNVSWRVVARLVMEQVTDRSQRRRILQFCRHRFRIALASHILIPSRMTKRLASIFLTQSGLDDPWRERKRSYNRRVRDMLRDPGLRALIDACPEAARGCPSLTDLRWELDMAELKRLFILSTWADFWKNPESLPGTEDLKRVLASPCPDFDRIKEVFGPDQPPKRVLYLPNASGGILFDLLIIRSLIRQGHKVILALKEGFYFQTPTIWDLDQDSVLAEALEGAHVAADHRMSKNALLAALRENPFLVISDGTSERLNLYRVSVTFARAWKEADVVLAKGEPHHRRLIGTSHQFTRDVVCFRRDEAGGVHLEIKPKSPSVRKFSESALRALADDIIAQMRKARVQGLSVMFYSAVVGSIPGETQTAISVLKTFVKHLRSRLDGAFVINPAEHFIQGMDGDDLMFMWERVQRSGLIDVWRFQTVQDIEKSFELMGRKVPPIWAGKDSTYSTGCTKEMRIALDVQRAHPEMQIIGPSADKFFRRHEYGVGKYYDAGINGR